MAGYRTLLMNLGLAIFGVLETFDWTSTLGAKAGMVVTGIGIMNMVLRSLTTTPIGVKPVK
jgi:hypothetical protein